MIAVVLSCFDGNNGGTVPLLDYTNMARKIPPLTIVQTRSAKPAEKLYKLFDGGGLALWVYPTGRKTWRLEYRRIDGKRDTLTLGSSDDFSLAEARAWRDSTRAKIAHGEDVKSPKHFHTFSTVFDAWYSRWTETVTPRYALQVRRAMIANVMNMLGTMDITTIKPLHIVTALTPMETRGSLEYLRRVKQGIKLVFDFAVARGLTEYNPALMISNSAFKPHVSKNFDALKPEQLPDLVRFLNGQSIQLITALCIRFQLLTLARPIEACGARWSEINFDDRLWTLPAERMKRRREHLVPLSTQAIEILRNAYKISADYDYVFIGSDLKRHMNVETARMALRRAKLPTTAHGLRSLGSTILNESGLWRPDVIEAALAHAPDNAVRAAYNRAQYLPERRKMLQWFSDLVQSAG